MAIKSLCVLSLGLILTAGLAYGETGSRSDVRQAAGFLEAKATGVRLFTRENVGSRGADLENFKEEMLSERIPALRREIDTLQQTVRALKDGPEPALAGGVEIVVESCWNKWKKLLAADKYLFRAVVAVDPGIQISEMAIRDLENKDMDATRIPNAVDRSDVKAGVQYEIYDSFKAWGSKAELVVEDQGGHEHTRTFSCNDVKDAVFH